MTEILETKSTEKHIVCIPYALVCTDGYKSYYVNEVTGGDEVDLCDNSTYKRQVVCVVTNN